jgi:hypothetical protein
VRMRYWPLGRLFGIVKVIVDAAIGCCKYTAHGGRARANVLVEGKVSECDDATYCGVSW